MHTTHRFNPIPLFLICLIGSGITGCSSDGSSDGQSVEDPDGGLNGDAVSPLPDSGTDAVLDANDHGDAGDAGDAGDGGDSGEPQLPCTGSEDLCYFVSATLGSDTNDGRSVGSPFATIQKAADVAPPGATVYIREGAYREQVNISQSGSEGKPIVFAAYPNERVVVKATEVVSGWNLVEGEIYSAPFDHNVMGRAGMTIFVNDEWVNEAHWSSLGPNVDMLDRSQFATIEAYDDTSITDSNLVGFPDDHWNGAHIAVQANSWSLRFQRVTDFDGSTGRVQWETPVGFSAVAGKRYVLFGTYEALDAPGEWYFDEDNDLLYLWAPTGGNPDDQVVEAKTRQDCFVLNGHDYISFQGLRFEGGDIEMEGSSHITIEKAHFLFTDWAYGEGSDPLVIASLIMDGSDNTLRDSEIEGICEQFILTQGENNHFINNYFHDSGYNNTDGAAIRMDRCGAGNLISHNTFERFGHSVVSGGGGYHFVIQNNRFDRACLLTADVGAIGFGNSSYNSSIVHHNVFTGMPAMSSGVYMDSMSADIVVHHNIMHDNEGWGLKINLPNTNILSYNNTLYNNGTIDGMSATENGSADGTRFYNNIYSHVSTRFADGGAVFAGNLVSSASENFVDASGGDFRLASGSDAIDTGVEIDGVTDGFAGAGPDVGALEYGEAMWMAGHDFSSSPQPAYEWRLLPFANAVANNSFENDLDFWTVVSGSPTALYANVWNYKDESLGVAGSRTLELKSGDEVEQLVTDLAPNTTYRLTAKARILRQDIQIESYDAKSSNHQANHFGNEYSFYGFSAGDWFRFDGVDFGTGSALYDQIEVGVDADATIELQVRLDDPTTGPLLATLTHGPNADLTRWQMVTSSIPATTGSHALYLVVVSAASDARVDRIRLLNTAVPEKVTIGARGFDGGAGEVTAQIGSSHWIDAEGTSFTTGAASTEAVVFVRKPSGAMYGYVETVSLKTDE